MNDIWATHRKGIYEGREVEVKTHSEGGYRVSTTQGQDHPGSASSDEAGTIIMPPTKAGRPIDIDGGTVEEVRKQLAQEGFSKKAIAAIVKHFPAP